MIIYICRANDYFPRQSIQSNLAASCILCTDCSVLVFQTIANVSWTSTIDLRSGNQLLSHPILLQCSSDSTSSSQNTPTRTN
ncbi:hypothetical protein EUGRSUZ_F02132 [Eucalyptus grandis]|uniref:Uncharacterized protein n=2 Tax=Eucalyptus grandis TaxID=71139 RepID=A0ACC3KHB2_EUCGR|nr:hypothetical protein EUGRSUZ_F02132 [Eucalyptus grandis]